MRHWISIGLIGLAVLMQGLSASPSFAGGFAACVTDAANRDLTAKMTFQEGMHDLIVDTRRDFAELAGINMRLQKGLAKARRARIDYLLEHDPAQITTQEGLSRFSNFPWSDDDNTALTAADADYARLEVANTRLREQNDAHPDWPDMRAYFQEELGASPAFTALMAEFRSARKEVETLLSDCPQSDGGQE